MALALALLAVFAVSPALAEALYGGGTEAAPTGDTGLTAEGELPAPGDPGEGDFAYKEPVPEELELDLLAAEGIVPQAATAIQLSAASISIGLKETYAGLTVLSEPTGSPVPQVTWRASNKRVSVDANTGAITGVRKGSAYVYATTADGLQAKCKVRVKAEPSAVKLSPASAKISVGMTLALKASVSGGAGQVTFESSKPGVATVDASGLVTAVARGRATITATTYNGKKAKCAVRVLNAAASLAFPDDTVSVPVGKKGALTATAYDINGKATVAAVTYAIDPASADPGCITLNPTTGRAAAVRNGHATVTATSHNGLIAACNVIVASEPTGVTLNLSSVSVGVQERFTGLLADPVPPEGEQDCATTLAWASSNSKVATVDDSGAITGVATGSCTIRVTTSNGKAAYCAVKVLGAPASVSISPAVGALQVGKVGQYKVTLSPKGSGGSVTYASSDTSVASIDHTGLVTALAAGVADITVTTYNGKTATAQLVVSAEEGGGEGGKPTSERLQYVINLARQQLGKPYIYGSGYSSTEEPRGFDCSGLVYWLFRQIDVTLLDSAYRQGYDSRYRKLTMAELLPGDLVFFNTNTSDSDLSDHSALYIGSGNFIHASSTAKKVIMSNLSTPGSYYYRTFSWGRRILE